MVKAGEAAERSRRYSGGFRTTWYRARSCGRNVCECADISRAPFRRRAGECNDLDPLRGPEIHIDFRRYGGPAPSAYGDPEGSEQFHHALLWLILTALVLSAVYLKRFRDSSEGRMKLDRWLLRVPMVGSV